MGLANEKHNNRLEDRRGTDFGNPLGADRRKATRRAEDRYRAWQKDIFAADFEEALTKEEAPKIPTKLLDRINSGEFGCK